MSWQLHGECCADKHRKIARRAGCHSFQSLLLALSSRGEQSSNVERSPSQGSTPTVRILFHGVLHKTLRIRSDSSRTTVKFHSPSDNASAAGISPEDFCGLVRRRQRGYLILNASNDGLVFEKIDLDFEKLKRLYLLKASSVSLTTVLEKRKLEGDDQLKLLLSYLLAKSIWQFYDSEWMKRDWTKDSIHFMRERYVTHSLWSWLVDCDTCIEISEKCDF